MGDQVCKNFFKPIVNFKIYHAKSITDEVLAKLPSSKTAENSLVACPDIFLQLGRVDTNTLYVCFSIDAYEKRFCTDLYKRKLEDVKN